MKLKLLFFATLLAFTSCSNNDDEVTAEITQPVTTNTSKISWNFPVLSEPFAGNELNYTFEYDAQGRVTKKVGGKLELSGSTGFPYAYSKSVYTTISYTGNMATMKNYSGNPGFTVLLEERNFEFDNQGRVIKLRH